MFLIMDDPSVPTLVFVVVVGVSLVRQLAAAPASMCAWAAIWCGICQIIVRTCLTILDDHHRL